MKVREIITLEGWVDGSGISYSTVYDDKITTISEDALNSPMDWSWWDAGDKMCDGQDTHIIVRLYRTDYNPMFDNDDPIAEWDVWASELV